MPARVVVALLDLVALAQLLARLALLLNEQLATCPLSVEVLIEVVFRQLVMAVFAHIKRVLSHHSTVLRVPRIRVFFRERTLQVFEQLLVLSLTLPLASLVPVFAKTLLSGLVTMLEILLSLLAARV